MTNSEKGAAMLSLFFELPNISIGELAMWYNLTPSEAIDLMCQALEEERPFVI